MSDDNRLIVDAQRGIIRLGTHKSYVAKVIAKAVLDLIQKVEQQSSPPPGANGDNETSTTKTT